MTFKRRLANASPLLPPSPTSAMKSHEGTAGLYDASRSSAATKKSKKQTREIPSRLQAEKPPIKQPRSHPNICKNMSTESNFDMVILGPGLQRYITSASARSEKLNGTDGDFAPRKRFSYQDIHRREPTGITGDVELKADAQQKAVHGLDNSRDDCRRPGVFFSENDAYSRHRPHEGRDRSFLDRKKKSNSEDSEDDEINSASSSPLPRGKRNGVGRYWPTVSPSNSSLEDMKVSKEKAGTFETGRGEDLDVTRLEGNFAATTGAKEPCLVGKQTTVEKQEPTPAKIRDSTLNGSDLSKTSYSLPFALGPNESMLRHRKAPWTDGDVAEGRQSMKQSNDDTLKITTTMTSTGRVIRAEGSYFPPIENIGMFYDSTLDSDEEVEFSQFGAEMESDRATSSDVFDGASYSYIPSTSSSSNGTFTSPDGPTQRSKNVASSVEEESERKINGHLATQSERLRKRIDSIKRSRRAMALARLHQQVPIESKDQELDLGSAYSGYPRHSPTVGACRSQAFQYVSGQSVGHSLIFLQGAKSMPSAPWQSQRQKYQKTHGRLLRAYQ